MPPNPDRQSRGAGPRDGTGAVYFEFVPYGQFVKVTAIDEATGLEVSIVGAAAAPQSVLQKTALAKLNFVLNKQR